MTETQRRIKAYQKALPELRERVIAVALLLAMSASMLSTASFAWLTLSRNPEVTNVSTNIAANGNLEIALATSSNAPAESQVGDSSATVGKADAVTTANITWGNLVNLSDPSYGLERMVMRPAKLNKDALLTSPLWGAAYSTDGRITELDSKFGYTIYQPDAYAEGGGRFVNVPDGEYGVRAISSMKMDSSSEEAKLYYEIENVIRKNGAAVDAYTDLGNDKAKISSLATMMGLFMTSKMADAGDTARENPEVKSSDLANLYGLYAGFKNAMELEADAIASMINLVLAQNAEGKPYTPVTRDDVLRNDNLATLLNAEGIPITGLGLSSDDATAADSSPAKTFRGDYNIIATDVLVLEALKNKGANQKWKDCGLEPIVNRLVNVNQCVIDNQAGERNPVSAIGVKKATNYLGKKCLAEINNGILYRFEERTGAELRIENMSVSVTVVALGIPLTQAITATIYTTASSDLKENPKYQNIAEWPYGRYIFGRDMKENAADLKVNATMIAQDTYGLAIDLWVRTNAANSYLTLEGNAITKSHQERAMGKDSADNPVELWTLPRTQGEESYDIDLYQVETTVDGETVIQWYSAETHGRINLETDEDGNVIEEPKPKMETIITVVGYEGENRVWNSETSYSNMLSTDATTQGSGSCYVYYADTPEDQARSMKLLESFKVAFVDDDGELMASAYMDTTRAYEATGRVTVPLVLDPVDSISLGSDENGMSIYGITALEEDVPKRITALVYLDGTDLYNEDVLSAQNIQGQLNIQFGSNSAIEPIKNEDLMLDEVHLNAEVDVTDIKWEDDNKTVTVTLNVEGVNPSRVTGFFMRQINATQGSREDEMTFTKVSDNNSDNNYQSTWEGRYTFTAPGDYILRMVRLDGVDYDIGREIPMEDENGNPVLDENGNQKVEVQYPQSSVSGFAVMRVTQSTATSVDNHIDVFSTDRSTPVNVSVGFGTSNESLMPRTVQARYVRDEDQTVVSGDLIYRGGDTWSGTVNFNRSGKYTLKYLVMDGNYTELSQNLWRTLDLTLGVYVEVQTSSPTSFVYIPEEAETEAKKMADNEKILGMYVSVKDDTNEPLRSQQSVNLYYGTGDSMMEATDMEWNGDRYEGEFIVTGPGSYPFNSVTFGESVLRTARNAPTFTIMSMVPPDYEGGQQTPAYQYAPNGDAYLMVRLTNASAASVRATLVREGEGEPKSIVTNLATKHDSGVLADGTTPFTDWKLQYNDANINNTNYDWPEGNWKLTKLELGNVFADDQMYPYQDENGQQVYFEPVITDTVQTKVVTSTKVSFAEGQSKVFGKDDTGKVIGEFLQSYDIKDLNVRILDFMNQPMDNVSNVRLEISYVSQSSENHGGYTINQLDNTTEGVRTTIALEPERDENGKLTGTYRQNATKNIKFAGTYTTVLMFDITHDKVVTPISYSSANNSKLPNTPEFEVYSKTPTVKVTGATPTNTSYSVDEITTGSVTTDETDYEATGGNYGKGTARAWYKNSSAHKTGYSTTRTNTSAVVYFLCDHVDGATYGYTNTYTVKYTGKYAAIAEALAAVVDNKDYHQYTQPTVTITLSGIGNASKAELIFDGSGLLFEKAGQGESEKTNFSWTEDGTCTRYIGLWTDAGNKSDDGKTAAGVMQSTQFKLTDSAGAEYTVTLADDQKITITNEY